MRAKRYLREYASEKIRECEDLKKRFPENAEIIDKHAESIRRAVWLVEHGYIIHDEAMRLILDAFA